DWMRKDLGICLDEARNNGAQLPLTALIEDFYARIQDRGEGRLDNTALYRLLTNP
ncbi:MAG: NAD(P)-dependent oxidoreductase, partial [Rhodospirillales bacterium]|nr:NAD(P)-dependent oxidoreductase [Rhodospirillales bacterium]